MKKLTEAILATLISINLFSAVAAAPEEPVQQNPSVEIPRESAESARPTIAADAETLKQWKETLEFGVSVQRIAIINEIYNRNDPKTFPLLIQILESEVAANVKKEAVSVIRRLNYREAAPALMKQLSDENEDLKQLALSTLGILGHQAAATKIMEFLDSSINSIKNAAITAAGDLKLKAALAKLHQFAESMETPDAIKESAIVAIGKIGDKSSIPVLAKIYDNPAYNKFLRMFCVTALGMIGGEEVFKHIKKAFESPEFFIKLRAVEAFSRINNQESAKYLSAALRDDNEKIRIQALRSIVKQPNKQQFSRQLQYMIQNETSTSVKKEAVITYIQIGGSDSIAYMKKQLEQPGNFFLKFYITLGLEKVEDSTSIPLLKKIFLDNKSKDLRNEIIKVLFRKNTEKAADLFKELLFIDEPENIESLRTNKINILGGLVRMKPEWVIDTFKKIIKDAKDVHLKLHAVKLVGFLQNKVGRSVVLDLINNPHPDERIQQEAVRSAGNLQLKEAREKLKAWYYKPEISQYMQYVLKTALVQLGEDAANLEAERKRIEAGNRQNRVRQSNANNVPPTGNNPSQSSSQTGNRSGVPQTFNPGR